ncbi:diguanylate cyclase domain-containing protein [Halomonas sp. A11-A]|uniref:sensor domain-containing diguanylate cyclase n=1 Tax=Halomonas sp. A11-A TaxID=2183985 RepID=UPI000D71068B|nr:diguanylate cyclase [Halomonas sp. A11-A]PWV78216.1 diguanylate cyclase with PAS/PAC sensor [Halomonas sp. A11-A]
MAGWLNLSLRLRLLLGVGLGWLALVVALLGYSRLSGENLARHENRVHLEYEAQLVADQLTRELVERKRVLARLAGDIDIADPGLESLLRTQQPLLALFDRLMVFDAEGHPVADWPPFPAGGPEIGERPYFQHVKAFRRPWVSEPYRGGETGIDQVMVIQPLLDDRGEFLGILGGNTSLRDGQAYLNLRGRRLGEAGHVLLATAEGQVISHPDEAWLMQALPGAGTHPLVDQALLGWQGSGEGVTLDGRPALVAFRQVWPANWVVGLFLPLEQLQAPIRRYARELRWVGIGSVALMLPLLWWLLGLGLRPLHRLERQIALVGQGKVQRLEPRTGMVELRQVADAFNRLEARRRQAIESLESREAFLEAVLASSPVGMFLTDPQGQVTYINPALTRLTGIGLVEYSPLTWLRRVHPEDRSAFLAGWRQALLPGGVLTQLYRFRSGEGEWRWLEVHANRVSGGGRVLGYVGLVQDITDRHEREQRQLWEAEHDPLTGCLNRRGFARRLAAACALSRRKADHALALVMLDLDHFKEVNDSAGHAVGDTLLQRVAEVLHDTVRDVDAVARLGGDEFAILLAEASRAVAGEVAERVRQRLAEIDFRHGGRRFGISASVGVALFSEEDDDVSLMERADQASYRAKQGGRNRVVMADTCLPLDDD